MDRGRVGWQTSYMHRAALMTICWIKILIATSLINLGQASYFPFYGHTIRSSNLKYAVEFELFPFGDGNKQCSLWTFRSLFYDPTRNSLLSGNFWSYDKYFFPILTPKCFSKWMYDFSYCSTLRMHFPSHYCQDNFKFIYVTVLIRTVPFLQGKLFYPSQGRSYRQGRSYKENNNCLFKTNF